MRISRQRPANDLVVTFAGTSDNVLGALGVEKASIRQGSFLTTRNPGPFGGPGQGLKRWRAGLDGDFDGDGKAGEGQPNTRYQQRNLSGQQSRFGLSSGTICLLAIPKVNSDCGEPAHTSHTPRQLSHKDGDTRMPRPRHQYLDLDFGASTSGLLRQSASASASQEC